MKINKEAVLTIEDRDLIAVVWRDKNGRQVFYQTKEMSADELIGLFYEETNPPAEDQTSTPAER